MKGMQPPPQPSNPQPASGHTSLSGVAFVIGSCISLQLGAALAMQLFPHLGAASTTALRLGIASVVVTLIVRPKLRGYSRMQWRAMALFGLSLGLMNTFFYAGIARIPLGAAVTIEFLGPLLLAAVLSRRPRDFLWVALALAGVALLGLDSLIGTPLDPVGVFYVLCAGACWAAYILASAKVGQTVPGSSGLALGMLLAACVPLPLGIPGLGNLNWELFGIAAAGALFASVLPYSFEFAALRRMPESVFGILLSLEPAFAALFGWLLLDQPITPLVGLAILLVIAASAGSTISRTPRPQKPTKDGSV